MQSDQNIQNEQDLKKKLTPEQYRICRLKGTEPPFTGKYLYNQKKGFYECVACGQKLFSSDSKYESGTGWPSFSEILDSGAVEIKEDLSYGMNRMEVVCSKCKSHLGHLFEDWLSPTSKDYCINSEALNFKPEEGGDKNG